MQLLESQTTLISSATDILSEEYLNMLANVLLKKTWHITDYKGQQREINLHRAKWSFGYHNRKRAFGLCSPFEKLVTLSKDALVHNQGKPFCQPFENTLRHEIAHALDFCTRGISNHDRHWRSLALQVGSDGKRCTDVLALPGFNANAVETYFCPKCDHKAHFYKKTHGHWGCKRCKVSLVKQKTGLGVGISLD